MNATLRSSNTIFALIVDPSFPLTGEKTWDASHPQFGSHPYRAPIITRSAPEAFRYLSREEVQFGSIYLNALLTPPGVLQLIRMCHKVHPGTPIFIIYDGSNGLECPFSAQELNRLAIQGAFERTNEDEFFKKIRLPLIDLVKEDIPAPSPHSESACEEFVSVPIQRFNFSSKIFFDVFIRVAEGKHLKIHSAGAPIPEDQLRSYLKKGVSHLYFRKKPHNRCLEYCDLLEKTFMTSSGISPAVKTATTFNRGHSLLERISDHRKDLNIPIDEILNFSQDIRRLFDQLDLNDARDFQALMQNVALYEHSLGTTVLSILLAKPMELDKEQSADILGIASFLHDIGLARMPPAVQSEDLSKMIGDQRELYFQHPALGAQILRDTNSVHPVAIQVVAQHHERRNGTGFPNRLVGQQIHKLSEVVGFSEELARLVQSRPGAPIKNVLIEMKSLSFEAYSLQIIEAFLKIFDPLLK